MNKLINVLTEDVAWLREAIGNTPLMATAQRLASTLAKGGFAHLIVGGLAVQERGYVRTTADVDVVVSDVDAVRDYLSINGFQEVPGTRSIVKDRANRVPVDLLPAGGSVGPSVVPLPVTTYISPVPIFADMETLVTQKLSSYIKNPHHRVKDLADVVGLIKANGLALDLAVDDRVAEKYRETWTSLQ